MTARPLKTSVQTVGILCYSLISPVMTCIFVVLTWMLPQPLRERLIEEGGFVETGSAISFFVAAAILVPAFKKAWPFCLIAALFGLRELDFDKSAFTEGLLKSRQYIGETVALGEKIYSAVLLICILVVVVAVIRRSYSALRYGPWDAVVLCSFFGIVLGVIAKLLDGIGRKLEPLGIEVSSTALELSWIIEEVGELGMALCLTLASFSFIRHYWSNGLPSGARS